MKAKKAARSAKKGDKKQKKYRTRTTVRFFRPKTFRKDRAPKYQRFARSLYKKTSKTDKYSIIKNPLSTEKAMKKMEDENTMVFIVDSHASKKQIRKAFAELYQVKVRSVNTLNRPDGKKKAYIRLSQDSDSLTLANKIGII